MVEAASAWAESPSPSFPGSATFHLSIAGGLESVAYKEAQVKLAGVVASCPSPLRSPRRGCLLVDADCSLPGSELLRFGWKRGLEREHRGFSPPFFFFFFFFLIFLWRA